VRRIFLAVLGLLFADGGTALLAQTPNRPASAQALPSGNGELRGSVVDAASNTGIARASIALRTKPEAALVAGAIAGPEGTFRVQGLRPGSYTLRINYLGYAPRSQDVTITDAAPSVDVGAIKLSRVAVTLEKVAITDERAAVTIEPDRNAYRAKDVAPAAGNASEVLDAVPSVQVDADGKVSLRGNENVAVQINGRPSPIRGPQLGAYLKGLPANIVERVEVIPNPSARYDPEGMAGIINIVLKQNTDLGMSGGLNAAVAKTDRYNASGNVGYQSGPLTLFTSLGLNNDYRPVFGINDRERLDALQSTVSYTEQDIAGRTGNQGLNLNSTADYRLNARDVITNAININRRRSSDASVSAYSELTGDRTLTDQYDRLRGTDTKGLLLDYTAAFKRTFEARKHELNAEVRLNRTRDEDFTSLWRQPQTASRLEGETDDTDALAKSVTGQVDYTRTMAPRTKLETGYKGSARWLDRDYVVLKDALGTGDWVRSDLSNAFTFGERVHAVYGVLSQGAGRFDFQAGLRGEYASRDFSLAAPAQSYPFSYRSLFPSGVATYNLSDATQMKVSYSRRIRRPGSQELNPFPSFFDVQNVFLGNPSLNPEYTDAIELGLTRNGALGSIQFSPFYRHTKDVIRIIINTADIIDGREVTSVSFKNLESSNSWGSDLNGSLRLGKKFNGFASVNVFKMVTDGGSTSSLGSNGVTWSSRVNATSELTPTLLVQGSYFYRAPMKIERGEFSAMQMANFTVRQKLDGDRLAVSLRINDPFSTGRFRIRAGDDNVMQVTERTFGARSAFLTVQYNYGQAPKIQQRRPEQGDAPAAFP
jgi:ferric enterobactin receptor